MEREEKHGKERIASRGRGKIIRVRKGGYTAPSFGKAKK